MVCLLLARVDVGSRCCRGATGTAPGLGRTRVPALRRHGWHPARPSGDPSTRRGQLADRRADDALRAVWRPRRRGRAGRRRAAGPGQPWQTWKVTAGTGGRRRIQPRSSRLATSRGIRPDVGCYDAARVSQSESVYCRWCHRRSPPRCPSPSELTARCSRSTPHHQCHPRFWESILER